MRYPTVALCLSLISACAVGPEISIQEIPASFRSNINNNLTPDSYPSFMAGAGNIYSCRYGINFVEQDNFSPPKEHVFAAYLKKHRPNIDLSKVTLNRLDVYHNRRLQLLDAAGSSVIGGAVGSAISNHARSNQTGFSNKKLQVYNLANTDYTVAHENAVGCDGKHEGEYYASKVTGGSSVIVSWFNFDYAGRNHSFRTTYEFQSDDLKTESPDALHAVQKALESSIVSFAGDL